MSSKSGAPIMANTQSTAETLTRPLQEASPIHQTRSMHHAHSIRQMQPKYHAQSTHLKQNHHAMPDQRISSRTAAPCLTDAFQAEPPRHTADAFQAEPPRPTNIWKIIENSA